MILNNLKDLKLANFKSIYEHIQNQEENKFDNEKVQMIFVNGAYCTGKRKFCDNLQRFGDENGLKLFTHKLPLNLLVLDEKLFIKNLIAFANENKVKGG